MVDDVDGAVDFYRPGGWNRIEFGGKQILIEDPVGNLIELFQPAGG